MRLVFFSQIFSFLSDSKRKIETARIHDSTQLKYTQNAIKMVSVNNDIQRVLLPSCINLFAKIHSSVAGANLNIVDAIPAAQIDAVPVDVPPAAHAEAPQAAHVDASQAAPPPLMSRINKFINSPDFKRVDNSKPDNHVLRNTTPADILRNLLDCFDASGGVCFTEIVKGLNLLKLTKGPDWDRFMLLALLLQEQKRECAQVWTNAMENGAVGWSFINHEGGRVFQFYPSTRNATSLDSLRRIIIQSLLDRHVQKDSDSEDPIVLFKDAFKNKEFAVLVKTVEAKLQGDAEKPKGTKAEEEHRRKIDRTEKSLKYRVRPRNEIPMREAATALGNIVVGRFADSGVPLGADFDQKRELELIVEFAPFLPDPANDNRLKGNEHVITIADLRQHESAAYEFLVNSPRRMKTSRKFVHDAIITGSTPIVEPIFAANGFFELLDAYASSFVVHDAEFRTVNGQIDDDDEDAAVADNQRLPLDSLRDETKFQIMQYLDPIQWTWTNNAKSNERVVNDTPFASLFDIGLDDLEKLLAPMFMITNKAYCLFGDGSRTNASAIVEDEDEDEDMDDKEADENANNEEEADTNKDSDAEDEGGAADPANVDGGVVQHHFAPGEEMCLSVILQQKSKSTAANIKTWIALASPKGIFFFFAFSQLF